MTMSGTCTCGRFLWYTSKEELLSGAKKHRKEDYKEFKNYVKTIMPDGLLICPKCGKTYSELEFSELNDCMGYGEHSGYTHDPKIAYQQAIANAYAVRYQAESKSVDFSIGLILILFGMLTYLGGTLLLMRV